MNNNNLVNTLNNNRGRFLGFQTRNQSFAAKVVRVTSDYVMLKPRGQEVVKLKQSSLLRVSSSGRVLV